jgi:hypothetical protein
VAAVKARIRMRYRRQLERPSWMPEEIEELGPGLRRRVAAWRESEIRTKRRLAWNALVYLANIDHNNIFAPIYAEEDFLEENGPSSLRRPLKTGKRRRPKIANWGFSSRRS